MASIDNWFICHFNIGDNLPDQTKPFRTTMHDVLHTQDRKMYTGYAVEKLVLKRLGEVEKVVECK